MDTADRDLDLVVTLALGTGDGFVKLTGLTPKFRYIAGATVYR